jgi:hypothetical protein
MGAWGEGPFDNDAAADWCGDLDEAPLDKRPGLIRAALADAADERDYLDVDVACRAVAAAAVVAAQRPGAPIQNSAYAPQFLADGVILDLDEDVRALALRALERVTGEDSEWRELWEDADSYREAAATLEPLREALSA